MENESAKVPVPYQWDYDGSCTPGNSIMSGGQITFSVGIFQWLPKSSGRGLKRGKVKYRIKGYISNPEEVYEKAKAKCEEYNRKELNYGK